MAHSDHDAAGLQIRHIDDDFSTMAQISVEDVAAIAQLGYKALVCTRPDMEDPGQPDFAQIAAAAADQGLQIAHIPVVGGVGATPEQVAEMKAFLAAAPKPILGYCRSGTRAGVLYEAAK
ncbi:hypothetical protein BVG79_00209 [Ketogulonicigenium robustum]|uniref:Beta-lactamase hydrolase-like protein phosphatase-like domain-containing protein n=1 Tax=Ketogulonicigenium robustum TaxID=92947 RepID=A0A1W6NWI5_9RHOB|nr:TIGR01244 family sulfur transferase [Ketogulonicigenium robustum]ARO13569.1 hypothetical protein BVG79_00209 [Ketogulonicigenium robustum]